MQDHSKVRILILATMNTKTVLVAAIVLTALLSTASAFHVTGEVVNGQATLTWGSQVNQAYEVMLSTNLAEGFSERATVQATPPLNTWWEEIGHEVRLYGVARPLLTNTPPASTIEVDQIINGEFSDGLNNWAKGTAGGAIATISESGGEAFADITDGDMLQWHVFLRQFDLTFSNGVAYAVRFDARAAAPRNIQVILQGDNGAGSNLKSTPVAIGSNMATYEVSHTMTSDPTQLVRLHFGLGGDDSNAWIDNVKVVNTVSGGSTIGNRSVAHEVNRRMGRGNNFMAAKSMNEQGATEDYVLLNESYFHHCRIGYKMDEVCGPAPGYLIPADEMANLQNMVDGCLSQGLVVNIDPIHNWANGPGYSASDLPKLSNIWVQVAAHFAGYDLENVVFEIMNEPHEDSQVDDIIRTGLVAIRSQPGNEERIVIVSGDGFSTRQALIDAFDDDEIPADDVHLIGTFHYYDPRTFTKSTHAGYNPAWGTSNEFNQVITDFDEVLTANTNWAVRNGTEPLPLYLGEFGVDNEADLHTSDRKRWLSWIRMQAEERGMSWAHWNMYQNSPSSKGMGPWTNAEIYNPAQRRFDADPVEALIGRYEFEDGSRGGGVGHDSANAGFTGTGYAAFPTNTGVAVWARVDGIYIPKDDTYTVQIHYATEASRSLRLVSRNDSAMTVRTLNNVLFPATGGSSSWRTLALQVDFEAGESADLKIVATPDEGVQLDWLRIEQ